MLPYGFTASSELGFVALGLSRRCRIHVVLMAVWCCLFIAGCDQGAAPMEDISSVSDEAGTPPESDGGVAPPMGPDDTPGLSVAEDLNPDPNIIEITLEARIQDVEFLPGVMTPAWTYNGVVPAPLIKAKVGDKLIVHLTNNLPESTSIHWHGLRIPNGMDGVPNVTQPPVLPGETFRYEFTLDDAGTYWYHPHINSAAQVGRGMYGPIVVEDPNDPALGVEHVLLLSDMGLEEDGQFVSFESGGELGTLFGREGNLLLVNGQVNPTLVVTPGSRQRWRVINAARSRYFEVAFDAHEFLRIGGDNGLAAEPVVEKQPVIVPGQRADLVVNLEGPAGTESQVQWIPTERGYGSVFARDPEPLFKVRFSTPSQRARPALPPIVREIPAIDTTGASELKMELTIDQAGPEFIMGINHVAYANVEPVKVQLGETQIWQLVNHTDFAHPFHVHGYFFQVIDDNGEPVLPLEWKDTVNVPVDHTVRIAINFNERPGVWMYHCHILDHAGAGMMGQIYVQE